MPAYVIYEGEVTDPVRYEQYKEQAAASIQAAGGRYVVRGGEVETLEGEPPAGRIVVVEFPSKDAAVAWYHGSDYTAARQSREGAVRARMFVVEGLDHQPMVDGA